MSKKISMVIGAVLVMSCVVSAMAQHIETLFEEDFNAPLSTEKWSRLDTAFSVADGIMTMTETVAWTAYDYIESDLVVPVNAVSDALPIEVGIDVVSNVWNSSHSGENGFYFQLLDASDTIVAGAYWTFQEEGVAYGLRWYAGGTITSSSFSLNYNFINQRLGFRVTDKGVYVLKNGAVYESKFKAFPDGYSLPAGKLKLLLKFRGPNVGAELMVDNLEVTGPGPIRGTCLILQ